MQQVTIHAAKTNLSKLMPWSHRNPFDRLLAATAMHDNVPLISADAVFDGIVTRLW